MLDIPRQQRVETNDNTPKHQTLTNQKIYISRCPKPQQNQTGLPGPNPKPAPDRVSHGTSFLAPGSLARRELARVIHHHRRGGPNKAKAHGHALHFSNHPRPSTAEGGGVPSCAFYSRFTRRLLARYFPFTPVYAPCTLRVRSVCAPCMLRVRFCLHQGSLCLHQGSFGLHQGNLRVTPGLSAV